MDIVSLAGSKLGYRGGLGRGAGPGEGLILEETEVHFLGSSFFA